MALPNERWHTDSYEQETAGPRVRSHDQNPRDHSSAETKTYPSRMCRICLEVVPPTYHPVSENLPDFLKFKPRVSYESEDPELGRLIRPCRCKGSSRYVHEGCLQSWRHASPGNSRNFWHCPTCGFYYRLDRVTLGKWISSKSAQIALTFFVFFVAMFALGFVADPIINLFVDPYDTLASQIWDRDGAPILESKTPTSWFEHFTKGLASLGVLSFLKVLVALSPWQWWHLRSSGVLGSGRRPAATGRSRVASVSWIVVVIGVCTFLWVSF